MSKLQDVFEDMKDKIINFLFSGNDKLIDKWLDDQDVEFDNSKFINLFQGDWSRKDSFPNNKYIGLDLDKVFLDKKFNPNQTISQTRLFKELSNEICRSQPYKGYNHNFNPNLYFLLYDKFNKKQFTKNIKGEQVQFYLKPIGLEDDNNKIIGIYFDDEHKKYFRDEILRIIELHSMFIFNPSIRNTKIIRNDKFSKIFIENAVIQYNCETENYYKKNKYIDFAYVIEENKENRSSIKTKSFFEIIESHHSIFEDKLRLIDILLNNEETSFLEINIRKMKAITDYFQEYLPNFLKLLYKSGYEYEAIVIFMVQIHKLQEREAIFGVQMKREMLDNKLNSIPKLPIFNSGIKIDDILIDLANEFDFNNDFINWKNIWEENKEMVKLKLKDTPKVKYMQNFIKLIHLKDFLTLTNEGVRKVISKLSSDIWTEQKDYWKYQNKLESKYIDTIESFMSSDKNILIEYLHQYHNLDQLKNFGIDKYNRTKSRIITDTKKLKELGIRKLHDKLPFLQYEEGAFVKWNNYIDRIYFNSTEEERVELKNKNINDIHKYCDQDLIVNYTVMSPSLIQKLNKL